MSTGFLVTGGSGFIGAHVVAELSNLGHRVISLDASPRSDLLSRIAPEVSAVQGSVLDADLVSDLVESEGLNTIVHLASPLGPATEDDPRMAVEVMCLGHITMLEVARALRLRRVVYASSIAVFGPRSISPSGVVSDLAPHDPTGMYGSCKSMNERTSSHYAARFGVANLGLRFPVVYGQGRERGAGLFAREMVETPIRGGVCALPFARQEELCWLHVEDAAQVTAIAAVSDLELQGAHNVPAWTASLGEVTDYIGGLVRGAQYAFGDGTLGVPARFDASPLADALQLTPRHTLEGGLGAYVDWMIDQVNSGH